MSLVRPSRLFRAGVIAAAVLFGPVLARSDFAQECRSPLPDDEPEIEFKIETGPVAWHNDKNRDQLRVLRANSGAQVAAVGPHWQSIGLTLNSYILAVEVRVAATAIKPARTDGRNSPDYCARLAAAAVRFGTQRTDVYVAREYQPGTCAHGVVRDHEARHVAIYQDAVDRYAPLIEKQLRATARALRPVRAATAQDGAERLRKALHDELSRSFDAMGQEVERANGALDTPAAYGAERERCSAW